MTLPRKPYVKKPISHSPRGEEILKHLHGYIIRTLSRIDGGVTASEVRTKEPGQCIAALRVAKKYNIKCLVYAIGNLYGKDGIEGIELVDEEFLLNKMKETK